MADPNLDEEDLPQEDEDTGNPLAVPTPPADREALRRLLMQKIQESDRGQQFNAKDSGRKTETDLAGQLAFNQALAKGAAQVGAIGGKIASTEPVDAFTAATLANQRQGNVMDQEQQGERDKLNQYIIGRLSAQDVAATKGDAAAKIAGIKGETSTAQAKLRADTAIKVANAGSDKNRFEKTDLADENGNALILDKRSGKYVTGPQAIKLGKGGSDDGSNPKDVKRLDDLGAQLTTGGRNAQDFKAHQQIVTNADKILQTEPQMKAQKGGLDKRQIEEVAIASANLLSSGSGGAQATIAALVPHSYGSDSAGLKEWLTSDPQGTNQQAFVERMYDTAKREKHLASEKIKSYRADMLANYSDMQENPRYQSFKKRYFGDSDQFADNGTYQMKPFEMSDLGGAQAPQAPAQSGSGMAVGAPAQAPSAQDPKVLDYGKAHGLDYGAARRILTGRGYKPNE